VAFDEVRLAPPCRVPLQHARRREVVTTKARRASCAIVIFSSRSEKCHVNVHRSSCSARLVIEPEIAATAAIHGTDANLDRISAALAALRHTMNDKRANQAADRKFHVSIAEATGNSVLVQLMTSVWEKEFAKNWS
jgi:DNA-binding FadR family transcriptional regulator